MMTFHFKFKDFFQKNLLTIKLFFLKIFAKKQLKKLERVKESFFQTHIKKSNSSQENINSSIARDTKEQKEKIKDLLNDINLKKKKLKSSSVKKNKKPVIKKTKPLIKRKKK